MAAETAPIRNKTRRLKDLALDKAIEILENPQDYDREEYNQTFQTVLKNAVPRTQLIGGDEDSSPVQVQITGMKIIKETSGGDNLQDEEPEAAAGG